MCSLYSTQAGNRRGRTSRTTLSRIRGHYGRCVHYNPCFRVLLLLAMLQLLQYGDDLHLLPLLRGVKALMARSTTTTKSGREARYFTKSFLISSLEPLDKDKNNFTLNSNKINTGALPVIYTNDPKTVSEWLAMHIPAQGKCTIGFDLESVPNAPWIERKASFRGPAVVQLSTPTHALVVHLAKASGRPSRACAPLLESVLQEERIVKAGCAIDQDMLELNAEWKGIEARSRFDLGGIGGDKSAVTGLRTLCAAVLHMDLPKSKRLAMSDWSQLPLTDEQLCYCARDAWVGAAVAAELEALSPATFAPDRLVRRLQTQRTLRDLTQRQANRKQAKQLLVAMQTPYSFARKKSVQNTRLPQWKQRIVKELKEVMRENRYDGLEVYDALELGLEAMVNRTI